MRKKVLAMLLLAVFLLVAGICFASVQDMPPDSLYMGNSRVKKYHVLGCKFHTMASLENRVYFKTRNEALKDGYDFCNTCRPDVLEIPVGTTYMGNSRVKKFHRLDCKFHAIAKPENRAYFKTRNEATQGGYETCNNCTP